MSSSLRHTNFGFCFLHVDLLAYLEVNEGYRAPRPAPLRVPPNYTHTPGRRPAEALGGSTELPSGLRLMGVPW